MMSSARSREVLWILLIALILLTAIVASATTLEPMSFTALTRRATRIAHLRCVSVRSAWEGGEIWTESRFAILAEEKADAAGGDAVRAARSVDGGANNLTVRMLGGRVDGMHSHVDGVPEFRAGEEVYLFLWRRDGSEPYRVLGWTQGTFRVTRDLRTGEGRVTQDSAGAAVDREATRGEARKVLNGGIHGMETGVFEAKLLRELQEGGR
jgi:hypothetical protein